jgi:stage II sporulation protein D
MKRVPITLLFLCASAAIFFMAACTGAPPPRKGSKSETAAETATEEDVIRIVIMQYEQIVRISVQGGSVVSDGKTHVLDSNESLTVDRAFLHRDGESYSLPATIESPNPLTIDGTAVYGHLRIQDGYLISLLPIEIYIVGVLNGELPASWPSEVLKAQAVVSRTYAYSRVSQHSNEIFDAGSSELFQKYNFTQSNEAIERAVQETADEILLYQNRPIEVFFHACSGGRTENSRDVFQVDYPYLRSIPDPYCAKNERFYWSYTTNGTAVSSALNGYGLTQQSKGIVRDIRIYEKTGSGRAASFLILHEDGERVIVPGNAMRLAIDATQFKSLLITRIEKRRSRNAVEFTFEGRGYGHGVGMSQWGAKSMADQGFTYRDILRFYYRGTKIGTVWDIR